MCENLLECQSIELELGSMAKSSSWYFANISSTFCSQKKSFVHLSVGGKMGLMRLALRGPGAGRATPEAAACHCASHCLPVADLLQL